MNANRSTHRVVALVLAAILIVAACGANDDDNATPMPTAVATTAIVEQPAPAATPMATQAPTATVVSAATEAPRPIAETAPISFEGLSADMVPELTPGAAVPGISGTAIDGTPFEWRPGSAPTVIVFLAHWCPACQNEVAELTHWLDEGNQLPEGVEFFGVSTLVNPERDNYPPSQWLRDEGWPFPVLLDDEDSILSAVFRLSGTPFWVVVNQEGRLVFWDSGQILPDDLVRLFNQLLAPAEG